jgi:hypothetical protein
VGRESREVIEKRPSRGPPNLADWALLNQPRNVLVSCCQSILCHIRRRSLFCAALGGELWRAFRSLFGAPRRPILPSPSPVSCALEHIPAARNTRGVRLALPSHESRYSHRSPVTDEGPSRAPRPHAPRMHTRRLAYCARGLAQGALHRQQPDVRERPAAHDRRPGALRGARALLLLPDRVSQLRARGSLG